MTPDPPTIPSSGAPSAQPADQPPLTLPDGVAVGVNLLWLVPGVVGGSEDYTVGLLEALVDHGTGPRPTLFVNRRFADHHAGLCAAFPVVVAPVSGSSKALRIMADNLWLPRQLRRRGIAVVHHGGGLVPFVDRGPIAPGARVLAVHDLQPLELPGNFSVVKRWFEAVAIPWSVRHADVVATLSHQVTDRIATVFDVPTGALTQVPPGPERAAAGMAPPEVPPGDVAERLGLTDGPWFVYPAITYPHKNHTVLVDAMATVVDARPDARLVLTGGPGPAEADVAAAIAALPPAAAARVVRAGRVPSADLVALYRGATAVVFPSRFEGFGLPVVEAMRLGCPVVVASTPALVEQVGDAAIVVEPDDAAGWAAAMVALCDDPDRRQQLAAAGRRQVERFSWPVSAAALESAWALAFQRASAAPRRQRLHRLPPRRTWRQRATSRPVATPADSGSPTP